MLHCSFYLEKPFQWYTHLLCEELQDEMYYICHSYPCIHWIYKIDPKFVIFGKMILSNILILNRYRLILLYIEENQLQIYEYLSLLASSSECLFCIYSSLFHVILCVWQRYASSTLKYLVSTLFIGQFILIFNFYASHEYRITLRLCLNE